MTLVPYDAGQLDQLALRLLDLSARVRGLAQNSRQPGITLELNDRKACEWLDRLEDWLLKVEGEQARTLLKHKGRVEAQRVLKKHPQD